MVVLIVCLQYAKHSINLSFYVYCYFFLGTVERMERTAKATMRIDRARYKHDKHWRQTCLSHRKPLYWSRAVRLIFFRKSHLKFITGWSSKVTRVYFNRTMWYIEDGLWASLSIRPGRDVWTHPPRTGQSGHRGRRNPCSRPFPRSQKYSCP